MCWPCDSVYSKDKSVPKSDGFTTFVKPLDAIKRQQLGVLNGFAIVASSAADLCAKETNPIEHSQLNDLGLWCDAFLQGLPHIYQSLLHQIVELRLVAADILRGEGLDQAAVSRNLAVDVLQASSGLCGASAGR